MCPFIVYSLLFNSLVQNGHDFLGGFMAGVLVLPGDKTLVVIYHRACSKEIHESLLLGIDTTGFAQLRFRVQGGHFYAKFLDLFVADTGNFASGD